MQREDIMNRILDIMNRKLNIGSKTLGYDDYDSDLFSKEFSLHARDMLVLFCEIERTFGIKISEEVFEKYQFRTINNIAQLVESQICL